MYDFFFILWKCSSEHFYSSSRTDGDSNPEPYTRALLLAQTTRASALTREPADLDSF